MSGPRRAQRALQALDGGGAATGPSEGQRAATGAPVAAVRGDGRLTVAPAAVVPAEPARWQETRRALRVLYRDFLAGGGLDDLRDQRSHAAPQESATRKEAA